MHIKKIEKKFKGSDTVYTQYRLVESYRVASGPRHRTVLHLGSLDIPKELFKLLADRIEELITGSETLFPTDGRIEPLATHYAEIILKERILEKEACLPEEEKEEEYTEVNFNSISNSRIKRVGAEHIGLETFKKLAIDIKLRALGFTEKEIKLSALSIIGRLVNPKSERETRLWAREISGIDELLETDFSRLSNNALYRISDKIIEQKVSIEEHLREKEKDLFNLEEKIILYDLTNTHLEGTGAGIKYAKYGRSKQKRSDCPIITLGLVIDEKGFPKKSEVFEGNVSEKETLLGMIEKLAGPDGNKKTIVMDAGIATEDNLKLMRAKGYEYVVVARNKPVKEKEITEVIEVVTVKEDTEKKVEVKMIRKKEELVLYCMSYPKMKKEASMRNLFQEKIEKELTNLTEGIKKKGTTKRIDKIMERIGRIKERHRRISRYYTIEVKENAGKVEEIKWEYKEKERAVKDYNGSYYLRTSRTDLDEKSIWSIYVMLTRVEESFRSLKSELKLRPVWHRKEKRAESHLFITVLAYHLLVTIQNQLIEKGINMRWERIRELMSTQVRMTTTAVKKEGGLAINRNTSLPSEFNLKIFNALALKGRPLKSIRTN